MVICPSCKKSMVYKNGISKNGRKYEFYGCSGYPSCNNIVEMEDANKYDDGVKGIPIWELSMEEQKERIRSSFRSDGFSWKEANDIADDWEREN